MDRRQKELGLAYGHWGVAADEGVWGWSPFLYVEFLCWGVYFRLKQFFEMLQVLCRPSSLS